VKIFEKFYVRRLYRAKTLNEILNILDPWINEVLYINSPFLRQVASYHLRKFGSSYAPKIFKNTIGNEILRLNDFEDLRSCIILSIIESYRAYNSMKGNVNLINWLSWKIPYEVSKLVTWRVTHNIYPFNEEFNDPLINTFEDQNRIEYQINLLCSDLNLDSQTKYYYLRKRKELLCNI
jgi:hypothetical protein